MTGFVHVADGALVDGSGEPIQLRGVGLGNWLLPEGYMWKLPGRCSSPRQIEAMIADLVGPERAQRFWRGFRDMFITEADIAQISREGFNHVRLPVNARLLLDDGFEHVDSLISWCRTHRLWVLLDLHGAPGGQTGTNIDDSPHGRPELFEDPDYRRQTVELWTTIALRYRDDRTVCGYDLLNEPLPGEYQHIYADRLAEVYRELTAAIRSVDPNHLITFEGSNWATNWAIFDDVWDPNSMLQFHKYWSPPDSPSIAEYLDKGRTLGLPIYMGEGGENTLEWIQTCFQLYDDLGVSWNFWPWKKMDTLTSPCSIDRPVGWSDIVDWVATTRSRPSPDAAWSTLTDLLVKMRIENCSYRADVVNAMLRRAPLRLPATGFTFRGHGVSYKTSQASPVSWFRRDDQVTISRADGEQTEPSWQYDSRRPETPEFVVTLNRGDWLTYEVSSPDPVAVDVDGTGRVDVEVTAQRSGTYTIRVTATSAVAILSALTVT